MLSRVNENETKTQTQTKGSANENHPKRPLETKKQTKGKSGGTTRVGARFAAFCRWHGPLEKARDTRLMLLANFIYADI